MGTIKFCTGLAFDNCPATVGPAGEIFLRVELPTDLPSVFKTRLNSEKSSGRYRLTIATAQGEKPFIDFESQVFVSRYENEKIIDLTLQAGEKAFDGLGQRPEAQGLPKNSLSTMSPPSLASSWLIAATPLPEGTHTFYAAVSFQPPRGDGDQVIEVAKGTLTYAMTAAGRATLTSYMNDYDKERFEKTPDDGITTGIHKANVQKVVFSTKKMVKGHDKAGELTGSIKAPAKGFYARMYLKESMRNHLADFGQGKDVSDTYYETELSLDDGKLVRKVQELLRAEEAMKFTSWSMTAIPGNPADAADMPGFTRKVAYLISTASPGKHTLTITSYVPVFQQKVAVSSGTVELTLTAADITAIAKKWGAKIGSPGLVKTDKTLEKQLRAVLGKKAVAVAAPLAWENKYNGLGVLTHRLSTAEYSFRGDDGLCHLDTVLIQQDAQGKGFGPAHLGAGQASYAVDRDLPCQNLK